MRAQIFLGAVIFLIVGCGGGPRPVPVGGSVTFDGKPLADGSILFAVLGEPPAMFEVKDGRYQGMVVPGHLRVEVTALRPVQGRVTHRLGEKEEPAVESFVPVKYNRRSTLTAEVTPQGPNQFAFELKSE
jgi:hypothetical protein